MSVTTRTFLRTCMCSGCRSGEISAVAEPLRVSSRVNVWPPSGEIYRSEGVTPFYETNQYNDVPAFTFGKCTISILNQLTAEQVGDLRSMISVLRQ